MTPDETNAARVASAMAAVARDVFLPERERRRAALDGPVAIGHGQTNSQPRTVADMLVLLDVHPGHRVLDVGSGSGWTTALLAHLVGPTGTVIGVERIPELTAYGRGNLTALGQGWAEIRQAREGVLGLPEDAPFDRILVSAMARRLPPALVAQLRDGGVMVVPVAGEMLRVVREGDSHAVSQHGWYRFVPLVE